MDMPPVEPPRSEPHLVPGGFCRVSVHSSFGFVDKVAEGVDLQRAVEIYRTHRVGSAVNYRLRGGQMLT